MYSSCSFTELLDRLFETMVSAEQFFSRATAQATFAKALGLTLKGIANESQGAFETLGEGKVNGVSVRRHSGVNVQPYGRALSAVLAVIEGAKESLVMACYEFTSRPIANALLVAQRRGVKVAVVADYKASLQRYSLIPYLARSGVPVRLDSHYAILHDKFIVTDGQDLELGSFNYTLAATTKNAECVLVLYQVPDIARPYFAEWQRLWDESR